MLRQLSHREQETLVTLGTTGPGGNFDALSLNKLFTLGLIEVDHERRIILTSTGRQLYDDLVSLESGKPRGDGRTAGKLFPPSVQPRRE
ncbi:MAG: hypothetical protein HY290_08425 [Planctomycetia bacterium]|nr:hypothetical protein [Planctomycetia bacterium]